VASELITAVCLFLTFTIQNQLLAMTFLTCTGFFITIAFTAIWALPMNLLPSEVMASSASFINFAGQIAGFISPIVMGLLVQRAGGSFGTAFSFLIIAILVSACIALTIREKKESKLSKVADA
jgi:fucose permease